MQSSGAVLLCAVLSVTWIAVSGHSYHLGSCPAVDPVADFDMEKLLGKWYVVQKTSTASSCLYYNYTRGEKRGEYLVEQVSEHFALGLTSVDHKYRYTGKLSLPDDRTVSAAKMIVRFPLSVGGSAEYTVFMTDYTNYAAIFTCQKLTFAHRQSVSILSRTPAIDKVYLDKIRMRMSSFGVDPYGLSVISQTGCAGISKPDGYDFNIDPDTLSAGNIAGVVRKAGEKIGDGIEVVANSANKYLGGGKEREEMIAADKQKTEWLP